MVKKFAAFMAALLLTLLPVSGIVSAAIANPIANPSAEDGTTAPTGWSPSTWDGTGTGNDFNENLQYVTGDAHSGTKSLKVTIDGYDRVYTPGEGGIGGSMTGDAGDAKWVFSPLTVGTGAGQLQAGKQYRVTFWYKAQSGVIPKVVSMSCLDSAAVCESAKFFGMPNPVPAANSDTVWTKYTDTFSVPADAKGVSVFAFLDQNGWIQTDDYSIDEYAPTGFNEGLLTLTYDDGHEDNVRNLLPLLNSDAYKDIKTTQCFETATLQTETATQSNLKAFQNAGHEICSHTINHPMLTQMNDSQLANELNQSKAFLESTAGAGVAVPNFASPYGDYDQRVINAIKAAGYTSHRTVDEGYNSKDNYDAYRIRVQNITPDVTAAQVSDWIAHAKADKTWLVLVYHRVVDTTDAAEEPAGAFDTTKVLMEQHLAAIKASGIKVQTMKDALTNTQAQINGTDPGTPGDTTQPVVNAAVDPNFEPNTAHITWNSNEAFTSASVVYGTTAAYGSTATYGQLGNEYVTTIGGLTNGTKYYYKISVTDAAGNIGVKTGEFTMPGGSTQPKFGDVTNDGVVNDDDATILFANWGANPAAGDLDNNGVVDDDDATLLFANWSK